MSAPLRLVPPLNYDPDRRPRVYIAGPMRGIPLFNFPAFDEATARARAIGLDAVSPAEIDREHGIDPEKPEAFTDTDYREALGRDIAELLKCDAIALLPGWRASKGANVELAVAQAIGLVVLGATTFEPLTETALQEAQRLVYGDRGVSYGHPLDDYTRTAAIWSAILGHPVTAEQAILCMIGVKISRECHAPKRDNRVDAAGYAECLQRVADERARRERAT